MEIEKLKKRLIREEQQRRKKATRSRRRVFGAGLLLAVLVVVGALYYGATAEERREALFQKGERQVRQHEYREAVATFRTLYEEHPASQRAPAALLRAAEILDLYLDRPREALMTYLLVERDYPRSSLVIPAQRQIARLYGERLRDYHRAIAVYQKILDAGVTDGDRIQYQVADAYFHLDKFEQARIEFEVLVEEYPQSPLLPEARYRIAVTHWLEGELEQAAGGFREVFEEYPENSYAVEARFGLAAVLEEQEKLQASLDILGTLRESYPNTEALEKKLEQVRARIRKKRQAT